MLRKKADASLPVLPPGDSTIRVHGPRMLLPIPRVRRKCTTLKTGRTSAGRIPK
ncbi:MAG: hypothetical protein A4E67_01451 [Syntrophaceae bacterium PtaB.Bin038]|nr:MAG: hypothetical protein A4E67_01451 [Syntrophaceae bacterium PtaB.Bin038]